MSTQINSRLKKSLNKYKVFLPNNVKGRKEFDLLYSRRKLQIEKAVFKLELAPSDFRKKGIEKIKDSRFGQFTIRVSKGDRLFYDVDHKKKKYILYEQENTIIINYYKMTIKFLCSLLPYKPKR